MAHVLNIVEDGGGTITLNSASKRLISYTPRAPQASPEALTAMIFANDQSMTVTESAVVEISGANPAAIQTAYRALETSLGVNAYKRQVTNTGSRVFVVHQPDGGGTAYRSEILAAQMQPQDDSLNYGRWFTNYKVNVNIAWTRRFYWEDNTERQIPLSNANGTADTSGLQIFNCNDGIGTTPNTRQNYVEMAASGVLGVLPCPPRLEYTHTFATNAGRRVYTAHGAQGTVFSHIIEAEAFTLGGICTAGAVATASGGTAVTVTNVPNTSGTALFTGTLSTAQVATIPNAWIRLLLRFSTPPNNSTIRLRASLQDSVTTAIVARSDWTTLNSSDSLQSLATLLFSPTNQGITTYGAIKLVIEGKDSAGTGDFVLDFVELAVIGYGSSFRYLKPIDETLVSIPASTGVITDNMIDGGLYVESRQRVYVGYGGPIMLTPGVLQRLYILHDGTDATAAITRTMTLKAFHRPRIITL